MKINKQYAIAVPKPTQVSIRETCEYADLASNGSICLYSCLVARVQRPIDIRE